MSGIGDRVIPLRTETIHNVLPATSLNNKFKNTESLPQNPGLADNNYNNGHQDSYCSESVWLTGPNSDKLRLIIQYNPYGFTPLMTCNRQNQMVAVSVGPERLLRLIIFNSECEILSATEIGVVKPNIHSDSFAGGYFFLNNEYNAVVVSNNKLACFPTANVSKKDSVYSLNAIWTSDNLVDLITKPHQPAADVHNSLYIGMPVWQTDDSKSNLLYWILLAGKYDLKTSTMESNAYVAVIRIIPDSKKSNCCITELLDYKELKNQWINNTIAVSPQGVFFVTNGYDEITRRCTSGYLYSIGFDTTTGQLKFNWQPQSYKNSGFLKPGQKNIGSGTTPTLFDGVDGTEYVTITDNAYPQMNVVVYKRGDGHRVSEVPVFPKMRGCDEASLIGVNGRVIVENNFGHTVDFPHSQYVANEPGIALIQVEQECKSKVIWDNDHLNVFGMSMLARKSGVIFANTGDWNVAEASTKGALYSISAIDSWDGREIWRIPLGQGRQYCRDYGGVYFNRTDSENGSGTSLFIGTERFLVSVQNYDESALNIVDEVKDTVSK